MNARLPLDIPTLRIYPHQNLAQAAADELGKLQVSLAPLRNREEALKDVLRKSGLEVVEGDLFRATITTAEPGFKTNWEQLARDYIPKEILDRLALSYTTQREPGAPRVSIKARKGV